MEPIGQAELKRIRSDVPILRRRFGQHRLAYLDSAATGQKPESVIWAMNDFLYRHNAPVHRGSYALAEEATSAYEGARQRVAEWIGASSDEIVFTRNATGALNFLARSLVTFAPGDRIVLSEMEHHSNIVPWQLAAPQARIDWIGVEDDGSLSMEDYQRFLKTEPRVVSVTHVSNVLGVCNPIKQMAEAAHRAGALFVVDGTQAAPRIPIDVRELGADALVFSGHKLYGPTGIGVLWARRELLENMEPWEGGGGMISRVSKKKASWASIPHRFESGTPPATEAVGLHEAIDWIEEIGLERAGAHERALADLLRTELQVAGARVFGFGEGIVSFALEGVHAHDVVEILNRFGIAVRAGHHCTEILMQSLGEEALVRASFAVFNQEEEVQRLVRGVRECQKIFA